MTGHLTMEQRQLTRRLHAKGLFLREIGHQVGCSQEVVRTVVRRESKQPVRSQPWQLGPGRLTLQADCFAAHGPFPDVAAAQAAVGAFREQCNQQRPHRALDDAAPASHFVPVPGLVRAELGLDIPAELIDTLPAPDGEASTGGPGSCRRRRRGRQGRRGPAAGVPHR
jgi:Helix-turn-helix domain